MCRDYESVCVCVCVSKDVCVVLQDTCNFSPRKQKSVRSGVRSPSLLLSFEICRKNKAGMK